MSFDIFLQCFRKGEPATFKRALVEEIFGRHAINFHLPLTGVNYADRGGAEIYGADDGDDIQSLMFNHCGGCTFFDALYELAQRTGSVVIWPTTRSPYCAVTDSETIADLPAGFCDEPLGAPIVVSDGRELDEGIRRSTVS